MTNPFYQPEIATGTPYNQLNAAPCAIMEFPTVVQDSRVLSSALTQYDTPQNQIEITDNGRTLAYGCPGGCPCSEYCVRGGLNRGGGRAISRGGCDTGGDPSDGGGCGPSDGGGGCGSSRGGLMRGLLGRFGHAGVLSRLFGGGGGCSSSCGGGCFGFRRGFRR